MRVLGTKSTTYSAPRYSSVCPRWRPNPFTSVTVMPETPLSESAARTSSSLKGLMIAVTSFMSGHSVFEGFPARRILQFPCHDVEWRGNPRRGRSGAGRAHRVLHHPEADAAPPCSSVVRPGLGYSSADVRADRDRGGRAGRRAGGRHPASSRLLRRAHARR